MNRTLYHALKENSQASGVSKIVSVLVAIAVIQLTSCVAAIMQVSNFQGQPQIIQLQPTNVDFDVSVTSSSIESSMKIVRFPYAFETASADAFESCVGATGLDLDDWLAQIFSSGEFVHFIVVVAGHDVRELRRASPPINNSELAKQRAEHIKSLINSRRPDHLNNLQIAMVTRGATGTSLDSLRLCNDRTAELYILHSGKGVVQ